MDASGFLRYLPLNFLTSIRFVMRPDLTHLCDTIPTSLSVSFAIVTALTLAGLYAAVRDLKLLN